MTSAMAKRDDETDHQHSKRVARMDRWAGEVAAALSVGSEYHPEDDLWRAGAAYGMAEALQVERTRRMKG